MQQSTLITTLILLNILSIKISNCIYENVKVKENSKLKVIVDEYMKTMSIPRECMEEIGYSGNESNGTEEKYVGAKSWNASADDFPLLRDEYDLCNRIEYREDLWVCNPDKVLTEDEASKLDSDVNSMLKSVDCACPDEQCLSSREQPPNGRFGLAIAVVNSVEGPSFLKKENMLALACSLAWERWSNQSIYLCGDGIVTVLATDFNEIATYAMPVAASKMPEKCIRTIEVELYDDLIDGNWYNVLSDMVEYYNYALQGEECGWLPGLPDLAIVVIFLSVLIVFASLIGLLLCCVGYCQNWEWVTATCVGPCIARFLGSIQVCVNLVLFGFCRSGCRAIGCDRCNKLCHPIDCVGEEVSNDDEDIPYTYNGPAGAENNKKLDDCCDNVTSITRQISEFSEDSEYKV